MAKKKSAKKSNLLAPVLRGIGWLWRLIAKTLGGMVRFIFRSSKELDPAHQRDGIAFFLFILAIVSAAGVWFDLDNVLGRATYAFLFGGVGMLANLIPVFFISLLTDYLNQLMKPGILVELQLVLCLLSPARHPLPIS